MVKVELPGVVSDVDRHGNKRYYLRTKGQKKIRIRGEPGTEEFSANHAKAVAGPKMPPLTRVASGSFAELVNAYTSSIQFKTAYTPEGQKWRIALLNNLCKTIGDKPYARLQKSHITAWMDARSNRPESANNLVKCLRGLFGFAIERKLVSEDPTAGIRKIQTYSDGFHTWTVAEVNQFFDHHPSGSKARMAICIALFSGLRRKDVASLGRQHIGPDGKIHLRGAAKSRRKKNKELVLPVLPQLQREFDATPKTQMAFLQSERGRSFSAASLGNTFRKWCNEAGLKHCTLHGLRKAGATIAANNGASDSQLMAIYGWAKADMATLYTEQRDREKLAEDGMTFLHFERVENVQKSHSCDASPTTRKNGVKTHG